MSRAEHWKDYEKVVARVQETLAPNGKVKWNDRILGNLSRTKRQIDVSIRLTLPPYQLLIAVECKHFKSPVDVKDVETSIGLFQDIGAHKGVIVSNSGFTEAAKTRAQLSGVDLLSLVDAERADWKVSLTIPILYDCRRIDRLNLDFLDCEPGPASEHDVIDLEVIQQNILDAWNIGKLPSSPGSHYAGSTIVPLSVRHPTGLVRRQIVNATIDVGQFYRLVMVPITPVLGFKNELSGAIAAREFEIRLTQHGPEIEAGQPIDDPSSIVSRPIPTLSGTELELTVHTLVTHHLDPKSEPHAERFRTIRISGAST